MIALEYKPFVQNIGGHGLAPQCRALRVYVSLRADPNRMRPETEEERLAFKKRYGYWPVNDERYKRAQLERSLHQAGVSLEPKHYWEQMRYRDVVKKYKRRKWLSWLLGEPK